MRILYAAMKHDYGDPIRGSSFEHNNFFDTLAYMGQEILYFDFMAHFKARGREWTSRRLGEVVSSESPELLFTILFNNELDPGVVRGISDSGVKTVNWFCDDHWRFESFSSQWAPCFNWVVTTAQSALPKYAAMGYEHVIKSQWACNPFQYRKLELPLQHEVTFVGQPHGDRRQLISRLREAGIPVQAWGNGWENGRVSQEEMIRLFNQSRINLNLTNASTTGASQAPEIYAPGWLSQILSALPGEKALKTAGRKVLKTLRGMPTQPAPPPMALASQIKGRNFEVPGCGGFLLTDPAENLEQYYQPGREIALFESVDTLVDVIRYYLDHEEERATIAEAGYRRTMREHTYVHRFCDIFAVVGLSSPSAEEILAHPTPSAVVDI